MRLKNLNLFEKYIEKAVLALASLFTLVVLWFFVLGSPHAVEIKALHKTLKPGEIEIAVRQEANDLEKRIASEQSPFGDAVIEVPPYTDEFRDRLTRPLVPIDQLASIFNQPGLQMKVSVPPKRRLFNVPQPPAPIALKWDTGFGVLAEPQDKATISGFEKLIGNKIPRDFRWVSVSSEFDLKRWQNFLRKKPKSSKQQQIPPQWWRPRLIVTDVILQRQLQDATTGKWGEIQTLSPLPGTDRFEYMPSRWFSFRAQRKNWAPPEAEAALQLAEMERNRLSRPLFPELIEGLWLPPDAAAANLSPRIGEQVRDFTQQIQAVQMQLKELRQKMSDAGGTTSALTTSATEESDGRAIPMDIPGLEAKRKKLLDDLYVLLGIIEPLEEPAPSENMTKPFGRRRRNVVTIEDSQKKEEAALPDTIRVWQHDISVQDGQSVRYRMMVSVLNPLFFKSQVPKEQQEEYFEKLTLTSAPSDWTEPVQILNEHHFFLSRANKQSKAITIEVYCIFNGQWQKREFDLKAGDPIGSVVQFAHGDGQTNVNMNVGGVVVDIDFDAPSIQGSSEKTTRIIYFDGKTNSLQQRTLEQDTDDPKRVELQKNLRAS